MTFSKLYESWTDGQRRSFDYLYAKAKSTANTLFGKGIEYIGIPVDVTPSPIEAIFAVPISQSKFRFLLAEYDIAEPYYNADDFSAKRTIEDLGYRYNVDVESIDEIVNPKPKIPKVEQEGS